MEREQKPAILTDASVFRESYTPEDAWYRSSQLSRLSLCLGAAVIGERTISLVLSGPSGTGKTLLAKRQLLALKAKGIHGCYVNGFEESTYYLILDKIIHALMKQKQELFPERRNTEHKLRLLRKHLTKPYILVVDEVDALPVPERDKLLYNLSTIPKLGFVLITQDPCVLFSSDKRIQSRVNPYCIEFKPYEEKEIAFILKKYAEAGLKEGTYNSLLLEQIAKQSNGDVRLALRTLRDAALIAQQQRAKSIQPQHIHEGIITNRDLRHAYVLKNLKEAHRLIYHLVKDKGPMSSGDLWRAYLKICLENQKKHIALRTFGKYVNKLVKLHLILAEQKMTKGNVRVFSVAE